MLKFFKTVEEYKNNKTKYQNFRAKELDFSLFEQHREDFEQFMKVREAFDQYKQATGDGTKPFFLMYASDVDEQGNITFNYDFNPDFIKVLRMHGVQGIDELEVLESYLHLIFSQNYFAEMFSKKDDENEESK